MDPSNEGKRVRKINKKYEGTQQVKSMVLKINHGVDDAMSHTNKIL